MKAAVQLATSDGNSISRCTSINDQQGYNNDQGNSFPLSSEHFRQPHTCLCRGPSREDLHGSSDVLQSGSEVKRGIGSEVVGDGKLLSRGLRALWLLKFEAIDR